MRILISGSSGLIGSALSEALIESGHEVVRLVRSPISGEGNQVRWDPLEGSINLERIEGLDVIVHLAGEPIAEGRWTRKRMIRIWDSRVKSTQLLYRAISRLTKPPQAFLCASAIGFYGDRGDEILEEGSSSGSEFISEVCRYWEAAAEPAIDLGIRVAHLRFGIVLDSKGGALNAMLPPFRWGLGAVLGLGHQYWSWIALEDAVRAICHVLNDKDLQGPINITSPFPVICKDFTHTLGKVLRRPAFLRIPSWAAVALFGQMAKELFLASTRVKPSRLLESGFEYRFPQLEPALRHILEKPAKD